MDITSLYSTGSGVIKAAAESSSIRQKAGDSSNENMFSAVFNSALDNLNATNSYIADANSEKIKFAMGETDSTHELTMALQKASACLQYTVAVRDKFMEAYREIMQMQI